jgi:hypothetical protein
MLSWTKKIFTCKSKLMKDVVCSYRRSKCEDDYDPVDPVDPKTPHATDRKNSLWCVSFGIFMIWFTTILLHLGVAFLPSSAQFSYDIGNCVFDYGTPKNYVIHVLWTVVVTAALVVAIICYALCFCKLRARLKSNKWTMLHRSMAQDGRPRGTEGDEDMEALQPPHEEEVSYITLQSLLHKILVIFFYNKTFVIFS